MVTSLYRKDTGVVFVYKKSAVGWYLEQTLIWKSMMWTADLFHKGKNPPGRYVGFDLPYSQLLVIGEGTQQR